MNETADKRLSKISTAITFSSFFGSASTWIAIVTIPKGIKSFDADLARIIESRLFLCFYVSLAVLVCSSQIYSWQFYSTYRSYGKAANKIFHKIVFYENPLLVKVMIVCLFIPWIVALVSYFL